MYILGPSTLLFEKLFSEVQTVWVNDTPSRCCTQGHSAKDHRLGLAFIFGVKVAGLLVTSFVWQKIFHFILISKKCLIQHLCQFDKVVSSLKMSYVHFACYSISVTDEVKYLQQMNCDPILEKVVKGEKRKTRLFTFQTKTHLNTI